MAKKQKKNRRIRKTLLLNIGSLIMMVFGIMLVSKIIRFGILPLKYVIPISSIIIIIPSLLFIISLKIRKKQLIRFMTVFCIVLTALYGVGNSYMKKTMKMFDRVTQLTDQIVNTISIRSVVGTPYLDLKNLNNTIIGTCQNVDQRAVEIGKEALDENNISYQFQNYENLVDLIDALYTGQVQAIVLNDSMLGTLQEYMDFDGNQPYTLVNFQTQVVYSSIFYTQRESNIKISDNRVDVSKEPFTVFISGNDSYGSLNEQSRSDVNMLVTVNPKSGIILISSIPRDYYLPIACEAVDGCPNGEYDKLTHTSLFDVDVTAKTIEQAFNVDINYTVRLNFSSLVNLVDALGGIDVYVEDGLSVESFHTNPALGVSEGWNHLDGNAALAFSRERYAYQNGDMQRVVNQQIVIKALIKKVTNPSVLFNYGKLLDAIGGAFETNMPSDDITELLKYEIANLPEWKIESFACIGNPDMGYSAVAQTYLSVTYPIPNSIFTASEKIKAVVNGDSSETVPDLTFEINENEYIEELYY